MYKTMKIYYDKLTGEVITSMSYSVEKTIKFENDYATLKDLNSRTKESIGLMV